MKTRKVKLNEVVLDFSIYPRTDVDGQHITYLREAEDAGSILPPVIIEGRSNRVVDGFHRVKMWQRKYKNEPNHKIEVIVKDYKNEEAILLDAIRYNANHGRTLTRYDRTHCILLAEKLHIEPEDLASALSMTIEKIGELKVGRVGNLHVGAAVSSIPLKRTIRHMSGKKITEKQRMVNTHLGGMNQGFYVNQLIMLIESDLLDMNDEKLLESLNRLYSLMGRIKKRFRAKAV